jgi:serine O-acetyltransferase
MASDDFEFFERVNELLKISFPITKTSNLVDEPVSNGVYESAIHNWLLTKRSLKMKYWEDWTSSVPNFFNSDHMTLFLYLLSRSAASEGMLTLADQISYLNKIRNGIDVWHSVSLPTRTLFVHSLGTVLGKAEYAEDFVCYQNVTVGASNGSYPVFRGSCVLYSGVSVLGRTQIGENVVVGAGTLLLNQIIPSDSKVYMKDGRLVVRDLGENTFKTFFR